MLRTSASRASSPTRRGTRSGLYNLAPMLWGTLFAMAGAVLLATPLGILSAVFCRFYAPPLWRGPTGG